MACANSLLQQRKRHVPPERALSSCELTNFLLGSGAYFENGCLFNVMNVFVIVLFVLSLSCLLENAFLSDSCNMQRYCHFE